ncbi:unnamed protein product [Rhizophagus irregularis]|nr:unnamed protein product [Rhizophagus irregularis]
MKQTYFREPKYSKNYLIPSQQNLYKQYVNAFAFSEMVKSQNFKKELQQQAQNKPSTPPSPFEPSDNIQIPPNATAQKHSFATLQKTKTDLYEFNKIFQMATSSELRSQFNSKIKKLEETIVVEKRLKQLKNHATSKQRTRKRKSFFMNDPEKMNSSIEFGTVDYKYHKEVIKVRTVQHLQDLS